MHHMIHWLETNGSLIAVLVTVCVAVLLVSCPDQRGLVHAITGVLLRHGANVVSNQGLMQAVGGTLVLRGAVDATSVTVKVPDATGIVLQ